MKKESQSEFVESLPKLLQDKKIIVGVCGSVAIYKTLEMIRILQKLGASVRVVMSEVAQEFIKPLLFEAISHYQVLTQDSQNWGQTPLNHIEIAVWGDLFIVAPSSANTINKIANGISDNVLLESFLAFDKNKLIAPAANTKMLENPVTQKSLEILQKLGVQIVLPECKELACGIVGNGALANPLEIVFCALRSLFATPLWSQCEVCVSGGGSKEALDDVRYLSNFSSGKMGTSLALAAYFLGAKVCFVSSKIPYPLPTGIEIKKVESSNDFLDAILAWQEYKSASKEQSFLLMSAAISDYIPICKAQGKLKKQEIGKTWNLQLQQNKDILSSIPKMQKTIGFKLESSTLDLGVKNAQSTLKNKNLDAICLNLITDSSNPLESQNNQIFWIRDSLELDLGFGDKLNLALRILQEAQNL